MFKAGVGFAKCLSCQSSHDLFEHLAAMLVIFELIEAGAGGSEQNYVAWLRRGVCLANGGLKSLGAHQFRSFNLRLDLRRCGPDCINTLHSLAQQLVEHAVVPAFVLAAENQMDVSGEPLGRSGCL